MKIIIVIAAGAMGLVLSQSALAQGSPSAMPAKDYPVCSKSVQDECINRSQAPKARMHKTAAHMGAAHMKHHKA